MEFTAPFVDSKTIEKFATIYRFGTYRGRLKYDKKLLDSIDNLPSFLTMNDEEIETANFMQQLTFDTDENDTFFLGVNAPNDDSLEEYSSNSHHEEKKYDSSSKRKHKSSSKHSSKSSKKKHSKSYKKEVEEENSSHPIRSYDDEELQNIMRTEYYDYSLKDNCLGTLDSTVLENTTLPLKHVLGLEGAKKLLLNVLAKPRVCTQFYRGLSEPSKVCCIYGPPGSGKRTLVKSFCRELSLDLIHVRNNIILEGMMTNLVTYANINSPCVIYFDHCDDWFREGDKWYNIGKEFFYEYYKRSTVKGDSPLGNEVWVVFGTMMFPSLFFRDQKDELMSNSCYAYPPNEIARRLYVKRVLDRQYSLLGGNHLTDEVFATLITEIAGCSKYCTFRNILEYVSRVFRDKLSCNKIGVLLESCLLSHCIRPEPIDFQSQITQINDFRVLAFCRRAFGDHQLFWEQEKNVFRETHSDPTGSFSQLYSSTKQITQRISSPMRDNNVPASPARSQNLTSSLPMTPRPRTASSPLKTSTSSFSSPSPSIDEIEMLHQNHSRMTATLPGRGSKSSPFEYVDESTLTPLGQSKKALKSVSKRSITDAFGSETIESSPRKLQAV